MAYNNKNNKGNSRLSNGPKYDPNHKRGTPTNNVKGGVFVYTGSITVSELAKQLNQSVSDILKYLFLNKKIMATLNTTLDDEIIGELCLNYGFDFKKEKLIEEENFEQLEIVDDPKDLEERPPVVVIMGHVDHGKTTLIDTIRNSHIADGEAGAITQAIGAYQKEIQGKKITFLDTPGHEAFTAMRARGASVTDIAIIVVAADDGVMPQTKEAIDHARAANVSIICAINKIDKPTANVEKVKEECMQFGLIPEEYGGDVIFKEISAKKNIGIDDLLETILVVAELKELKANPKRYAMGTVIEAQLDKNEGAKATLLVQNGTLKTGDSVVIGNTYCRVRKMVNEYRKVLKVAGPATPVVVTGIEGVPQAGDRFMAYEDEKIARNIASKRALKTRNEEMQKTSAMTLNDLYDQIHNGEVKNINLIIRADVQGSVEAIKSSLEKIDIEGIKINIIRATAGSITQSDVLLASASNAIIYGFNVRPDAKIKKLAEENKISIRLHNIIYKALEEVEAMMKGMLAPVYQEVVLGQATVRQIFKVSKIGTIAGCMVDDGVIKNGCGIRLIRDGVVVYTGKLGSLQRFKDNVKEVKAGYECGLTIERFNDIKEGDIIEGYEDQQVKDETNAS